VRAIQRRSPNWVKWVSRGPQAHMDPVPEPFGPFTVPLGGCLYTLLVGSQSGSAHCLDLRAPLPRSAAR